jgi:hypothetical protein
MHGGGEQRGVACEEAAGVEGGTVGGEKVVQGPGVGWLGISTFFLQAGHRKVFPMSLFATFGEIRTVSLHEGHGILNLLALLRATKSFSFLVSGRRHPNST